METPRFCSSHKTRPPFSCWKPVSHFPICRTSCPDVHMTTSRMYHYNDVIMGTIASQITSLTIVYSTVYSDADQRKHQSSASLAFVRGIHRGPGTSPHKWPVTRKMFPFDDVIMYPAVIGCNVDTRLPCRTFAPPPVSTHPSFFASLALLL